MKSRARYIHWHRVLVLALSVTLLVPAAAGAAKLHTTQMVTASYGATPPGFARTADGTLHAVFSQSTNWGDSYNGIAAVSITPSGHVGPQVQALNWNGQSVQGDPGLAVMPSGALEATWGGYPFASDGPWGISSNDGGSTWSTPVNIGSGSMQFGDSHVNVQVSNGTPVLTAGCCGGIVIQQGFGPGSPTYQLVNSTDGSAGNTDSATDAATGAVVDSWGSNDGTGGLWLQQVAPGQPGGPAVKMPIPMQYGTGSPEILAGRDSGPGVFGAYAADYGPGSQTHIRLLRYGGGSVAVGSVKRLFAHNWGVATGPNGRIWVMWWGQNTKTGKYVIAFTRSNKAVTRFEPIQVYGGMGWASLFSLSGDGRLGPLDALLTGDPTGAPGASGVYHARIAAELSAQVSAKSLGGGKFKLQVKVTDAGDAVSGAHASAKGNSATTNGNGKATFTVTGSSGGHVTVTITAPGYRALQKRVKL
jgi:hypothetical protein